ncbi:MULTISPECIES: TRAP transporter permease [Salinibaculum]|uniref:TRAP transporter permease n=1 Tax=Salinibaculum TaxID=2732368 RepID=UPI0030CBC969
MNLNSLQTKLKQEPLRHFIIFLSVIYWGVVLYYGITYWLPRPQFAIFFVGGGAVIYVFSRLDGGDGTAAEGEHVEEDEPSRIQQLLLVASMVVVVAVSVYLFVTFEELFVTRPITIFEHEYILGAALLLAMFYLTYDGFGLGFLLLVLLTMVYSFYGQYFPGLFSHAGLSFERLIEVSVLDIRGLYGSVTRIVAAWVAPFLLYAGLIRAYGGFDLVKRISIRAAGFMSSGIAQTAVISSMLIGSINGAKSANAAMTGSFTIPLMKESGLPGRTAAAIESVASSGGQVMPPVMGSAAFLMASFLGTSYTDVLIAGMLPALFFYFSVAIAIHFATKRYADDLRIDPETALDNSKSRTDLIVSAVRFGIPFFALVYLLGIANFTVVTSALLTAGLMFATGISIPLIQSMVSQTESVTETLKTVLGQTLDGVTFGAKSLAPIALMIALINVIVDLLNSTGMPGMLALAIISISGGVLIFAAILGMVLSFVMDMGMPTVAAYSIVAILIAPTFVGEFGVPEIAAHYFVFYGAVLSGITPPIAIAVVVTTGIADSDFWLTSLEAIRIGATLYILPIAFLFKPTLVTDGLSLASLLTSVSVLLGIVTLIYGMNFVRRENEPRITNLLVRIIYFGTGATAVIHPDPLVQYGVLATAGILYVIRRFGMRLLLSEGENILSSSD